MKVRPVVRAPATLRNLVVGATLALVPSGAGCDDAATTTPEPVCRPSSCAAAPLPACDGNTRVAYAAIGNCIEVGGGTFRCEYPEVQRQDCTALEGRVCDAGQCVVPAPVPCADVVCNDQPAPDCAGDIAQIYGATGTCDPTIGTTGACVYPVEFTLNCADLNRPCRDGGCPDPDATPCDPNPCDVPNPGTCDGPAPRREAVPGTCTAQGSGATNYECAWTLNEFPECSGTTPVCAKGICAKGVRAPAAGEAVFHEILANPSDEGDLGEWFELHNPTDFALDLTNCLLKDDGTNRYTFATTDEAVIPAQGFLVVGRSPDRDESGGFVPDVVYANFQLGNSRDALELICNGVVVDRVAWDSSTWPVRAAKSMALKAGLANAVANDQAGNWCLSAAPYGNRRNQGTPRTSNGACEAP
jgi:hypothetical protein